MRHVLDMISRNTMIMTRSCSRCLCADSHVHDGNDNSETSPVPPPQTDADALANSASTLLASPVNAPYSTTFATTGISSSELNTGCWPCYFPIAPRLQP